MSNIISNEKTTTKPEVKQADDKLPKGTQKVSEKVIEEQVDNRTNTQKHAMKFETKSEGENFSAGFNLNIPFREMLQQAVEQNLDGVMNNVQELIKQEAKKLQPNTVYLNKKELRTVKGQTHKEFERVTNLLTNIGQVFIAGETGSGKTFLASQVAEGLNLDFGFMSCSAGISEAHILGRMLMDGSYASTEFVEMYENGGVFLMDEVDSADANTLLIINSAIANGKLHLPNRKGNQTAKRHPEFYLICSANTWGDGSADYYGREFLDAAFMNRFSMSKVKVDYHKELELKLTGSHDVCKSFQKLRDALKGTEKYVSTRTILDGYKLVNCGMEVQQVIEQFVEGFMPEEVEKV